MRRAIVIAILAVFACGVAQAASYEWNAGAATKAYDDCTTWTPVGVPGASDSIHLGVGAAGATVNFHNSTTMALGSITIDNGTLDHLNTTGTIQTTGNFLVHNNGSTTSGVWYGRGNINTLSVGGNLEIDKCNGNGYQWTSLVLTGTGTLDARDGATGGNVWANGTLANGTSYSAAATNQAAFSNLQVNGTITGGTWTVYQDSNQPGTVGGNFVLFGTSGSMTAGELVINTQGGNTTSTLQLGGATYPKLTIRDDSNGVTVDKRTIRMKGDITVTSDFNYDRTAAGYATGSIANFTTDNGSGKFSNLTVGGNLYIGGQKGNEGYAGAAYYDGFTANSSTITVFGSSTFDCHSYINGSTSKWNFGGDVTFMKTYAYDNSSLKTTTFNIVGTTGQTLDFGNAIPTGKKLPLGNLVINKLHGIASLADNVLLTGNFRLQAGGLSNTGNYWINMQGGQGTWGTAQTFENDNSSVSIRRLWVKQGSPTWVKLNSNLAITDNLDVDPNCILFTNGYTLTVNGGLDQGTYGPSSLAYTTREGGLILVSGVPEPATLALLGTGGIGLIAFLRRRRLK